jgi:hypothetical protein
LTSLAGNSIFDWPDRDLPNGFARGATVQRNVPRGHSPAAELSLKGDPVRAHPRQPGLVRTGTKAKGSGAAAELCGTIDRVGCYPIICLD